MVSSTTRCGFHLWLDLVWWPPQNLFLGSETPYGKHREKKLGMNTSTMFSWWPWGKVEVEKRTDPSSPVFGGNTFKIFTQSPFPRQFHRIPPFWSSWTNRLFKIHSGAEKIRFEVFHMSPTEDLSITYGVQWKVDTTCITVISRISRAKDSLHQLSFK